MRKAICRSCGHVAYYYDKNGLSPEHMKGYDNSVVCKICGGDCRSAPCNGKEWLSDWDSCRHCLAEKKAYEKLLEAEEKKNQDKSLRSIYKEKCK